MTIQELESQRRYRAKNPEKIRLWGRLNRARHIDYHRKNSLNWYHKNKDRAKRSHKKWILGHKQRKTPILTQSEREERAKIKRLDYLRRNKERIAEVHKAYRIRNVDRIRLREKKRVRVISPESRRKRNDSRNRRYKNDIQFYIRVKLSRRIAMALRYSGAYKSANTITLIGCSVPELKQHLEAGFVEGMTWQNRRLWHIDHIRPCSSFDLSDPIRQKECFHFSNLQPLWSKDNLHKSNKWSPR